MFKNKPHTVRTEAGLEGKEPQEFLVSLGLGTDKHISSALIASPVFRHYSPRRESGSLETSWQSQTCPGASLRVIFLH